MKSEFIPPHPLNTAVLFLVFNRPDTTKQVFEAIRKAKPPRLYVAADGPRTDRPGEEEKVKAVREFVMDSIDWDCEVNTLFRDSNLGCKYAVSGAITWFFEHEEMGIILEDDCLPSQSFFWFCEELLERYRDDTRIFHIAGLNVLGKWREDVSDYFYSIYGGIWGWATWRRVWKYYDADLRLWENPESKRALRNVIQNNKDYQKRIRIYEDVRQSKIDTWDYQFGFMKLISSGLSIVPSKNLILNIGFGVDATHTKKNDKRAKLPVYEYEFPLKRNVFIVPDNTYQSAFLAVQNSPSSLFKGIIFKVPFIYYALKYIMYAFVMIRKAILYNLRRLFKKL